jgi:hypothetical protein
LQSVGYLSSEENISIIATLDFNVIVRGVMALHLVRIIWYDFKGFLYVEIFDEEPFFSRQIAGNERWEHGLWVSCSLLPLKDLSPSREAYYRGPRM